MLFLLLLLMFRLVLEIEHINEISIICHFWVLMLHSICNLLFRRRYRDSRGRICGRRENRTWITNNWILNFIVFRRYNGSQVRDAPGSPCSNSFGTSNTLPVWVTFRLLLYLKRLFLNGISTIVTISN